MNADFMLHTFNLQAETTKWLLLHSLVYNKFVILFPHTLVYRDDRQVPPCQAVNYFRTHPSHVENRFHFKRFYKERLLTNSAASVLCFSLDFYLKMQIKAHTKIFKQLSCT